MSASVPMRSQLLPLFAAYLAGAGCDAVAVLAEVGLGSDTLGAAEVTLPIGDLARFFEVAEAASGDRWLGIHVAAAYRRGTYGLLEYATRTAPDVRGALTRLARYMGLINELVRVRLVEDADGGVLEHRVPGRPLGLGRHGNEFFLALVVGTARELAGPDWAPEEAWLAHPAPGDVGPLVEALGTSRLRFAREHNGLRVRRAMLDRALATAEPPLLALLDRQAETALRDRDLAGAFVGRVRSILRGQLVGGPPRVDDLAAALQMSPRTLQRRLADYDTSYREVVDDLRSDLARLHVGEGRSVGEVAFLLGYSEITPFTRAFRRWTGTTPSRWRARRGDETL